MSSANLTATSWTLSQQGSDERARMSVLEREGVLINEALAGDHNAFAALLAGSEERAYRMAIRTTRNHEDAEDAVQEALCKAYSHLGRFQGKSRFSTWLIRIALNESLMLLRKRRSEKTVSLEEMNQTDEDGEGITWEFEDPGEDPEALCAQAELAATLNEALESLPPRARAVFTLRELEQLSTLEAAKKLRLSVSAVKGRLRSARSALRQLLGNGYDSGRLVRHTYSTLGDGCLAGRVQPFRSLNVSEMRVNLFPRRRNKDDASSTGSISHRLAAGGQGIHRQEGYKRPERGPWED